MQPQDPNQQPQQPPVVPVLPPAPPQPIQSFEPSAVPSQPIQPQPQVQTPIQSSSPQPIVQPQQIQPQPIQPQQPQPMTPVPGSQAPVPQQPQVAQQAFQPQPIQPQTPGMVAPQQQPQQFGGVVSPQSAQSYAPVPDYGVNGSHKKRLIMVVGGVVAVLIIIAIAAFVLLGSQKVITYKSSDLETSIAGSYNVKHPKQWQDYTDDKDALSAFGSLDEIDDYRVFAYGYDKDLGAVQAGILSGTIDFPVSDSEMTQILAAPGGKEQIEPAMKKAFAELAEGECKAISGKEPTFNYESDTYVMEIKASYECTYSEADRDKKLSDKNYLSIFIGLKGEKLYIVNVGAIDLDWAKNQNFYESVLSPSIQPK